jgi:hypothetical protein
MSTTAEASTINITRELSEAWNTRIVEIDNDDGLAVAHGKALPYLGWYWRSVDWTRPVSIGNGGGLVGFMESNKWGYESRTLAAADQDALLPLIAGIVAEPAPDRLAELWSFLRAAWDRAPSCHGPTEDR